MKNSSGTALLDLVYNADIWQEFYEYKLNSGHMNRHEAKSLASFISEGGYLSFDKNKDMPLPCRMTVNKSGSSKKRTVYCFPEQETYILKLIAYLLYKYDERLSASCYSFRRHSTAKKAIANVMRVEKLDEKYVLKADIHNYFNSIPSDRLADELGFFVDDAEMLDFLRRLVIADAAVVSEIGHRASCREKENMETAEKKVHENRGAMAGVPVSPFFANLYLKSLDDIFEKKGVPYFRYSDDILIIAQSREEITSYLDILEKHIREKGLELNPEKVVITGPGEKWDFLGFSYYEGSIDLSDMTVKKMKDKIRRRARKIYRRKVGSGADFTACATALIKTFNKKYYDEKDEGNFTWSRWFFPVITSDSGLKKLDRYMLEYVRFLYSGRHYKGNYRISYEQIKELGYKSLVHEYYRGKSDKSRKPQPHVEEVALCKS